MNSKVKKIILIVVSVVVSVALVCSAAAVMFSKVNLSELPNSEITVEAFSEFTPPEGSAEISTLGIGRTVALKPHGEVKTDKLGTYILTYRAGFLLNVKKAELKVTVVDTTAPVIDCDTVNIELAENQTTITAEEIKLDYKATDNYDGDLTEKVKISVEDMVCRLTVSDSSGNETVKELNIIPNDDEYPTLLLSGTSTYFLHVGTDFKEPGFSAKDNRDGDLTKSVKVSNNINKDAAGEYRVDYTVSDAAGNVTKLSRKVVVYGAANADSFNDVPANGKVVYLTFDDGPGPYTEELLGYLDRYNVKATFFVTNQFPNYQHLLGTIDKKGHAIGVHTLTHKWSIYKSEENYYNDFNAMQNIIKQQTGKTTNIFRFPGGTNNTVSKNYKGIMTRLSTQMVEQGYYYFDWNADCNDSRTSDVQQIISDTLRQIKSKDTAVVLMHDIKKSTVKAIPAIIEECKKQGYAFMVLTESSPAIRFEPRN